MPLKSDLSIDRSKLDPSRISERTRKFNASLVDVFKDCPKWYEIGIVPYRRMRENGQTPLPGLTMVREARTIALPSREPHRQIPCRVFRPREEHSSSSFSPSASAPSPSAPHAPISFLSSPSSSSCPPSFPASTNPNSTSSSPSPLSSSSAPPLPLFLHIHGGGWILGSEYGQDRYLQYLADVGGLVVVSVGYRLAPEHPYPAANRDCVDVAEYLVDHGERDFGAKLEFVGGESAGGHLSAGTILELRGSRPGFRFRGAVLSYGMFDLTRDLRPGVYQFEEPLVINREILEKYLEAYLAGTPAEERRSAGVSPVYAELHKIELPPAIFACGTLDPLLDDSVVMSTKWALAGADTILKLYPGAPHGFTLFAPGSTETTQQALDDIVAFIRERS